MKESRMIEEMSRLEFGCEGVTGGVVWTVVADNNGEPEQEPIADCPDYLHDHNAVQRVIDGFDDLTADDYMYKLDTLINGIGLWAGSVANAKLARATCHQKVEAILKACGKWSDGNDGGEIV